MEMGRKATTRIKSIKIIFRLVLNRIILVSHYIIGNSVLTKKLKKKLIKKLLRESFNNFMRKEIPIKDLK